MFGTDLTAWGEQPEGKTPCVGWAPTAPRAQNQATQQLLFVIKALLGLGRNKGFLGGEKLEGNEAVWVLQGRDPLQRKVSVKLQVPLVSQGTRCPPHGAP